MFPEMTIPLLFRPLKSSKENLISVQFRIAVKGARDFICSKGPKFGPFPYGI